MNWNLAQGPNGTWVVTATDANNNVLLTATFQSFNASVNPQIYAGKYMVWQRGGNGASYP